MDLEPAHFNLVVCLGEMEQALGGLFYPSESDALVSLVIYADPLPDADALEAKLRGDEEHFEVRPAEDFFRPVLHNPYWASEQGGHLAQKYARLRDVMASHLADLQTYRVGKGNVTVYLLGRHGSGCHVGVCTHAVET